MSDRPLILGMNNPLSDDPEHALYPHPEGCAGHRLYEMLRLVWPECTRQQYLDAYERRNLVVGEGWSARRARDSGVRLVGHLATRTPPPSVAVLGAQVWRALGLPPATPVLGSHRLDFEAFPDLSLVFWRVPHPSGRNLWYNVEGNRLAVGRLLLELRTPVPEVA